MNEQMMLIQQLNDFLARRGMRAKYLAEKCGISVNVLYNFKAGRKLITKTRAEKIKTFIQEYDQKLGA